MSWHFSRALVAEYSAPSCSALDVSAQSSATSMPDLFCCSDKTTECCPRSLSGTTLQRSTVKYGEDVLACYLAGFPVKTSPQRAAVKASQAKDPGSGFKWPESLARYDQLSHSWKTRHYSLFEDLTEYSLIWPRSGTMRSGEYWRRPRLEPLTYVKEFGFSPAIVTDQTCQASQNQARTYWPTPTTKGLDGGSHASRKRKKMGIYGPVNPVFIEFLQAFPINWTDLRPSAMPKFLSWLRMHFDSLRRG